MFERSEEIEAFLTKADWVQAKRISLAGDLSSRSYLRLIKGKESAILMDATETMVPFRNLTDWLLRNGFSAPMILADQAQQGLLLLEDFGDTSLNTFVAENGNEDDVDVLCVDLLLALRRETPPALPCPNAKTLVTWTQEVDHHYFGNTAALSPFRKILEAELRRSLEATKPAISLRDFHADNLMWLPTRQGIRKLGLLDYQDAFITHPIYDLVSYLTDARVSISADRRKRALHAYLDRSGDDEAAFTTAFAVFSAQRNLRILGIFARAAKNGKSHHLPKLPRVHQYLDEALQHEVFEAVREQTLAVLPKPNTVVEALS